MTLVAAILLQAVISPPLPSTPPAPATGIERIRLQGKETVLAQLFLVRLGSSVAVNKLIAETKMIPVSGSKDSTDLADYYAKEFLAENGKLGWFDCNSDRFEVTGTVNCDLFAGAVGQRVDKARPTHRLAFTIKDRKVQKVSVISTRSGEHG